MTFRNVREPWEIHDTIKVCSTLYGSEDQIGFFNTFVGFAQRERHLFFKNRSEGNCHLAYNNQQAADRTDFVFHVFTVGVHYFAPITPLDMQSNQGVPETAQDALPSFWTMDLPQHCAATLRVGQDDKLDANAMMLSPGYGPNFSGAASATQDMGGEGDTMPELIWAAAQGVPGRRSRFFTATDPKGNPKPISIPRNDIIEMSLDVSEYARGFLGVAGGPGLYWFDELDSDTYTFPTCYGIQCSLYGFREVQQRGQLHA